jgi:hypothetical protein
MHYLLFFMIVTPGPIFMCCISFFQSSNVLFPLKFTACLQRYFTSAKGNTMYVYKQPKHCWFFQISFPTTANPFSSYMYCEKEDSSCFKEKPRPQINDTGML